MKAIVHKDIKPENLLIDDIGYIHITDLGIARQWKPDNNYDNAGTPEYMGKPDFRILAPEILLNQQYGVSADYYAVGIICYELVKATVWANQRPYKGKSRKEIIEKNKYHSVTIEIEGVTQECKDFINKVIH